MMDAMLQHASQPAGGQEPHELHDRLSTEMNVYGFRCGRCGETFEITERDLTVSASSQRSRLFGEYMRSGEGRESLLQALHSSAGLRRDADSSQWPTTPLPARTELTVLPGDPTRRPIGLAVTERTGIGVVNPRGISALSVSMGCSVPYVKCRICTEPSCNHDGTESYPTRFDREDPI